MSDLDNHARFTGYVSLADGTAPRAAGLERWFPAVPAVRD